MDTSPVNRRRDEIGGGPRNAVEARVFPNVGRDTKAHVLGVIWERVHHRIWKARSQLRAYVRWNSHD